ncbi:MAG: hypothetical protein J6X18_00515 [Bacteroidales bacterium]|nr:hypothetical protein [Bacteroidales bacterium]
MSKIAEQKSLEAYPQKYDNLLDANVNRRIGYRQGYEQAMQDFMDKACEWFEIKIICYSKREYEELIEQFKNYMQNEK